MPDDESRKSSDAMHERLRRTAPEQWHILTIETAAPYGGVCLSIGLDVVAAHSFSEPQSHTRQTIPVLDALLGEAQWATGDIDVVIVDRGPGSHTGTRIGLTTARLFAWQMRCVARGVTSLDVLAAAAADRTTSPPADATIIAMLLCRRGELYVRRYRVGAWPRPLEEARTLPVDRVRELLSDTTIIVGEGAAREAEALGLASDDARLVFAGRADDFGRWPTVEWTLRVGFADAVRQSFDAAEWAATLAPLYLHRPLAKTVAERLASSQ